MSLFSCQSAGSPLELSSEALEEALELVPVALTLVDGDTLRIRARSRIGDSAPADLNPSTPVMWTSSAPEVAIVEDGLIRGISPGEARVTAISGSGAEAFAAITVTRAEPGATGPTVAPPPSSHGGMLPAFPGAEGWGATALKQCRSLPIEVLTVSTTNRDGPGSFDQVLTDARSDRFTFILFNTGGKIHTPRTHLNASCVYIAGQTAPGDGVVVANEGIWLRGDGDDGSDIVIRYLRFRGAKTNMDISKGSRIVLDHNSFSWARLYGLSLQRFPWSWSQPISNVSVQHSIVSETLAEHPTGFVLGGPMKEEAEIGMTNISIHRNLMASNSHRNPMLAADNAVVANNVIYNWRNAAGMMNRRGTVDWTNNFGKPGPMARPEQPYLVNPYCNELAGDFSIYATGNVGPAGDDPRADNWSGPNRQVACMRGSGDHDGQEVPAEWRRLQPQNWAGAAFPITLRSAHAAYDTVVDDVGANARVTCDGSWVKALDPVDARVIAETKSGSGPSRAPEAEGPWPTYRSGTPCGDADRDGLPDRWEERFFGCATCADPQTVGSEGYLLIEHYVNGTDPR